MFAVMYHGAIFAESVRYTGSSSMDNRYLVWIFIVGYHGAWKALHYEVPGTSSSIAFPSNPRRGRRSS